MGSTGSRVNTKYVLGLPLITQIGLGHVETRQGSPVDIRRGRGRMAGGSSGGRGREGWGERSQLLALVSRANSWLIVTSSLVCGGQEGMESSLATG